MKRYISLAMVAVALVFSLAVPSFASETGSFDNIDYINVLDYNDIGLKRVSGYDPCVIDVDLPGDLLVTYVDFILLDRTGGISSVNVLCGSDSVPLYIASLGDNYYRVFGDIYWQSSYLQLQIDHGNSNLGWFSFCSFNVFTNNISHFSAPLVCQGFTPVSNVDLSLHTGDNRPTQVLWTIENFDDRAFSFTCFSPDWRKYDYLDIQVIASVSEISSISAVFGEIAIPYTVSNIYSSNTDDNPFCISIRLDLRGLYRSSSTVPEITIAGQSNYEGANGFLLSGCSGYTIQRDTNPLFYYFKKLTSDLSGFFSDLGSSIVTKLNSFELNVTEWFSIVDSSVSTWGQNIVNAIVGDDTENEVINDALHTQDQVNEQINVQLGSAISDWDGNISIVSGGFDSAVLSASPALQFLSNLAQGVFTGMGWFGTMFFFIGFVNVFFLFMNKTGLGSKVRAMAFRESSPNK